MNFVKTLLGSVLFCIDQFSLLQPFTLSSVAHFLTTSIGVVALHVSVVVEDSIFHAFDNKICKGLLGEDSKKFARSFLLASFCSLAYAKSFISVLILFPTRRLKSLHTLLCFFCDVIVLFSFCLCSWALFQCLILGKPIAQR